MARLLRLGHTIAAAARHAWRLADPALQHARRWPHGWRQSLLHLALPTICAGCEQDLEQSDDLPLCLACRQEFSMPEEAICARCAAPSPIPVVGADGCIHCHDTLFRFKRVVALAVYRGQMRSFVLRMKHLSGESLALAAGQLLAQRIRDVAWNEPPDLIAAAPMHWTRRLWRNVNAPAIIAETAAKELKLPLALDLLRAVRMVSRQATLTPHQRRRNMRGAFAISRAYDVRDAHVLVIDDVMTTGATANSLARPLLKAGAKTISIGVVARGIGAT